MAATPEDAARAIERSWETAQRIQADPALMAHLRERIAELDDRHAGPVDFIAELTELGLADVIPERLTGA